MNGYFFPRDNKTEQLKRLLLEPQVAVSRTSPHIALSANKLSGLVCTASEATNFFKQYQGKLIFLSAAQEAYLLIRELFNSSYKAKKYFSKLEDVSLLVQIGKQHIEPQKLDLPLEPLSAVLDRAINLWHTIPPNIASAQYNNTIQAYSETLQPAIFERLKLKLAAGMLEPNKKEVERLTEEASHLVQYIHNHPTVILYNEHLASKSTGQFTALYDPLNKSQTKTLLKALGYPPYNSVFELLYTGDHEQIISAICGVIRRSEIKPINVPSGYKIKVSLLDIEPKKSRQEEVALTLARNKKNIPYNITETEIFFLEDV